MGIIPVDFLYTVDRLPVAEEKLNATGCYVQTGGPIPNAIVGLARLGMRTAVIAVVGNDWLGNLAIEELKSENVDTRWIVVKRKPSATAIGFIEKETGRRTIALYRDIFVTPTDLKTTAYPIPRVVHLDGRDLDATMRLARWAKRVKATVVFDIGSIRNDVSPVFPLVDHLVVADAFAFPFTRTRSVFKAIQRLAAMCPGCVVITEGTKGATGYEPPPAGGRPKRSMLIRRPAFKVRSVDTTGAGDLFHTGYLYGLLQGLDMADRLRFGAATAALKCTRPGGHTGAPTLSQLRRFLAKKPETYA